MRAAPKQPKQEQMQYSTQVIPFARSACAQQVAEDQAQIGSYNVDLSTVFLSHRSSVARDRVRAKRAKSGIFSAQRPTLFP